MYKVEKITVINANGIVQISNILYDCGKDMASKYDLHHWDNSKFKWLIIIILCLLKNQVFLVKTDTNIPIATFQIKQVDKVLRFEKLCTSPKFLAKGIGTYCMNFIEQYARDVECKSVNMEVYEPSHHAIDFYQKRGYKIFGKTKTLKYSEIKMIKEL